MTCPELDPRVFEQTKDATSWLCSYVHDGLTDFRTIVLKMIQSDPKRYYRVRQLLRSTWNAIAEQEGYKEVSKTEVVQVLCEIENGHDCSQNTDKPHWFSCDLEKVFEDGVNASTSVRYTPEELSQHRAEWLASKKPEQPKEDKPMQRKTSVIEKTFSFKTVVIVSVIAFVFGWVAFWFLGNKNGRYRNFRYGDFSLILDTRTGDVFKPNGEKVTYR